MENERSSNNDRSNWIESLVALGIPGSLWILFDDFFSSTELIYYRGVLILLAGCGLSWVFRKKHPAFKFSIAPLLIASLVCSHVLISEYHQRAEKVEAVAKITPPLELEIQTRDISTDQFAILLNIRNQSDSVVKVSDLGAQNSSYGFYRDFEEGALMLLPGKVAPVLIGNFTAQVAIDMKVQLRYSRAQEKNQESGQKASFSSIAKGAGRISPSTNIVVDPDTLNGKAQFVPTVLREKKARLDLNLTREDGSELGGELQTPPLGRLIAVRYDPLQRSFNLKCGSGYILQGPVQQDLPDDRVVELSLPSIILADQFDTTVQMEWDFDLQLCKLTTSAGSLSANHLPAISNPRLESTKRTP